MSLRDDMKFLIETTASCVPITAQVLNYVSYRKQRKSIEASLRLRKIVLKDGARLATLEFRDNKHRRVLVTQSELDSPEIVLRNYESLFEKDLSLDYERIHKQVEDLSEEQLALDSFEIIIGGKQHTGIWRIFNAGLIQALVASRLSDPTAKNAGGSSILGLMLGRRMDAYARAYVYSISALVIGFLSQLFLAESGAAFLSIIIPLFFLFGLTASQKILEFRVSRGYFGNNAGEAAEFIKFIQSHSDRSDFNDGDKMRRLFPELGAGQFDSVVIVGQGATT